MAGEVRELINQVAACPGDHVVFRLVKEGVLWKCYDESACRAIAELLGPPYIVVTKAEFLEKMEIVDAMPPSDADADEEGDGGAYAVN